MIDLFSVSDDKLNKGTQLLREQFKLRGWSAQLAYEGSAHIFVDRGDGKKLHIFATTPANTTYAAAHMANDKFATYQMLLETSTPQPETVIADVEDTQDAVALLQKHGKVVVKPSDAGHGKGITVGVTTKEQLVQAIAYAKPFNRSARVVVVQQLFDHEVIHDLRLLCINYKFVGSINRVPAQVTADGVHTVEELIELENNSDKRGEPYHAPLAVINLEQAKSYLGEDISKVYPAGAEVRVMSVANFGAGGEIHDVTDQIPQWMRTIAEDVSRQMELQVCGVDFMTDRLPDKDMAQDDLDAVIIEVNKAPSLAIHDTPTTGQPRGAVAAYVEYLSTL